MAEYQSPEWHPAAEEYCEAIFELREDDVDVIQARIAERLMVSRPAVSEMVKRLEHDGLVRIDRNKIDLSPAGLRLAEKVVRKHRLAECFLTEMLGLHGMSVDTVRGFRDKQLMKERVAAAGLRYVADTMPSALGLSLLNLAVPPSALNLLACVR